MASEVPAPTPVALVLCDNVYRDSHGKQALVGLFSRIIAPQAMGPIVHPRMCVFVSVTSIRNNTECSLDIVNAEDDQTLIELKGPAPHGISPVAVWDVVFELPPITFPDSGTYYVRFLGNGHVIMQRAVEVIRLGQAISGGEDDEVDN